MTMYNNGFPATYQQLYPQYQPSPMAQQAQQNQQIWVSGEAGAKAYLVAPNSSVLLWDTDSTTIYIKSADASGMPSMKILDYTVRETPKTGQITTPVPADDKTHLFATKDDIKAVSDEIASLRSKIERMEDKE